MAGPIRMYAMRQIVQHDVPVQLPTCMYRLPKIQGAIDDDDVDTVTKRKNCTSASCAQRISPSATSVGLVTEQNNQTMTMALVQERQEVILKQLDDLKKQMTAIRGALKSGDTTTTAKPKNSNKCAMFNVKQLPAEVSINVNPSNPPYSLLLLQKIWKNSVNFNIQSYVHSTVPKLPENVQTFVESISEASGEPNLTVRLIWKAIGVNQLEITGARPIQGEVNLLRYLARLTSSLNYDEDSEMDSYLDTCYTISRSKTKSERLPLLQRLNKKLAKEKFIFSDFSIVDIAAYSAIKQTAAAGEVNVGMAKWMHSCEAIEI